MRTIEESSRYKRDLKREAKGEHGQSIKTLLPRIVNMLAHDEELPVSNDDHPLRGEWKGCRGCHIRPDLVLIYQKANHNELELLELKRLGSHSELF